MAIEPSTAITRAMAATTSPKTTARATSSRGRTTLSCSAVTTASTRSARRAGHSALASGPLGVAGPVPPVLGGFAAAEASSMGREVIGRRSSGDLEAEPDGAGAAVGADDGTELGDDELGLAVDALETREQLPDVRSGAVRHGDALEAPGALRLVGEVLQ